MSWRLFFEFENMWFDVCRSFFLDKTTTMRARRSMSRSMRCRNDGRFSNVNSGDVLASTQIISKRKRVFSRHSTRTSLRLPVQWLSAHTVISQPFPGSKLAKRTVDSFCERIARQVCRAIHTNQAYVSLQDRGLQARAVGTCQTSAPTPSVKTGQSVSVRLG